MVKKKLLPGGTFKKLLTKEEVLDIEFYIYQGFPEAVTREKFQITKGIYYQIYNNMVLNRNRVYFGTLGAKIEPYYTEEELLKGIPEYTWESLSNKEKQFYYGYKYNTNS